MINTHIAHCLIPPCGQFLGTVDKIKKFTIQNVDNFEIWGPYWHIFPIFKWLKYGLEIKTIFGTYMDDI